MSDDKRTGVVLAAGFGSRLQGIADGPVLKPLTPVAGVPLFERTLRSLSVAGCERVVVVLGFEADSIRRAIEEHTTTSLEIEFVTNEYYHLKNGVSVLMVGDHVKDEFILTMADHVFSDDVMRLAGRHQPPLCGASLLVDYKLESIFDMDDATKVLERGGRIERIGKTLTEYNCIDTGLFVCTVGLSQALRELYDRRGDVSLSDGVQQLAAEGLMTTVDIGDGFWQDVDTPEMLAHAEQVLSR